MSGNASQESTSQKGKSAFRIFYSRYKQTTIVGQWGYVGKPPPLSSTTSSTSSTASASRASSAGSRALLATPRPPLPSIMPPRARPASRPDPGSESPATSSQRPILGVALPTSFSFLKRETVTPATATPPSVPGNAPMPVTALMTTPVSIPLFECTLVANEILCHVRRMRSKWLSILSRLYETLIPKLSKWSQNLP